MLNLKKRIRLFSRFILLNAFRKLNNLIYKHPKIKYLLLSIISKLGLYSFAYRCFNRLRSLRAEPNLSRKTFGITKVTTEDMSPRAKIIFSRLKSQIEGTNNANSD